MSGRGHEARMAAWDHLPAAEAVARAWQDPGPRSGTWHQLARVAVADRMPMLARGLDRLLLELDHLLPNMDPDLWAELPVIATVPCPEVPCRCGHLHARHSLRDGSCQARDCGCSRFTCSCRGARGCEPRPTRS